MKPEADAVVILPGDIALVDHEIINAVIDEYLICHPPIVVAGHGGRSGHPVLFDKSLFGELGEINEETRGLESVLSSHRSQVRMVETSEASLLDVDRQDDMSKLAEVSKGVPKD
jgi:molybdenum cofactor cytidylyltransferase